MMPFTLPGLKQRSHRQRLALFFVVLSCSLCPKIAWSQFNITVEQFDQWVFSNTGNEQGARAAMKSRVETEIMKLESQLLPLSDTQKDKIRLAGSGDIKRFFDDYAEAREKFLAMGEIGQEKINEAYQLASPLMQRLNQGLFGDDSLLQKVAYSTLTPVQTELVEERRKIVRQRQTDRVFRVFIAQLENTIPITGEQRVKLSELLRNRIKLKKPGSQHSDAVIYLKLSELPEKVFEPIFDEQQITALNALFRHGRGMRAFLIRQGAIDENE